MHRYLHTGLRLAALGLLASSAAGWNISAHAARGTSIRVFLPVLIFHHVKWLKPSDNAIERGLTVLPTQFVTELTYLQRNGYHTVSARQIALYLRGHAALPSKSVALTFDDGYADVFPDVYRVLKSRRLTATFFIVPGFLGSPRYLTWAEVKTMADQGMDIEAHTLTHPDLRLVPSAQQWTEIADSRSVLQQRIHHSVHVFAYPYGGFDSAIVEEVKKAGYWAAFTTQQGWILQSSSSLTLPRVYIDLDDSIDIFAGRLRAEPQALAEDPT